MQTPYAVLKLTEEEANFMTLNPLERPPSLSNFSTLTAHTGNEPITNLMAFAVLCSNSSIHSFTRCRPLEPITRHFDPRDPLDINISEHLLQQYIQDHKKRMTIVYGMVFIRNSTASRQKLAPRHSRDTVLADLQIHIYNKKRRGPEGKSCLKRVPVSAQLLRDQPDSTYQPPPGTDPGVDS
ncbi:hypothetical protein EVAR_83458_1 [Eumeta japonica]|uniref:Uncharacterized protein n=1 Tax=Eumeta variegata TaxID=151549 RepID=A0A4C1TYL4_EUMVA|nr:hypothetical protein EVAR_83458_1 [Eumeta japonica]